MPEELMRLLARLVEEERASGEAFGVLEEVRLLREPRELEHTGEVLVVEREPAVEEVVVEARAGAGGLDVLLVERLLAGAGLEEDPVRVLEDDAAFDLGAVRELDPVGDAVVTRGRDGRRGSRDRARDEGGEKSWLSGPRRRRRVVMVAASVGRQLGFGGCQLGLG